MQFFTGISSNTHQPNFTCHHWLSVSGNSEIMHYGILVNMAYWSATLVDKCTLFATHSSASPVTAKVRVQVNDIKATLSPSLVKSLSAHPTSLGAEGAQMNIPIEVQLSDRLIHKLLRQSRGEQLKTIHRIAQQRANAAVNAATTGEVSQESRRAKAAWHRVALKGCSTK